MIHVRKKRNATSKNNSHSAEMNSEALKSLVCIENAINYRTEIHQRKPQLMGTCLIRIQLHICIISVISANMPNVKSNHNGGNHCVVEFSRPTSFLIFRNMSLNSSQRSPVYECIRYA
ncbi:hypothetical protein CLIB1423_13S03620 [[Candida] railenensis]|uniref:Uncharacterized protein n=1 Tax=[Candida] railenensis TaxID=45579 RepID=A0A9P0VYP6_9ASCO|nr:hypothetical protein CLIB1423_13S03620 [[Candida] railenensis]